MSDSSEIELRNFLRKKLISAFEIPAELANAWERIADDDFNPPQPRETTVHFRKKPVEIEAVQWTGDNEAEMTDFAGHAFEALDEPSNDDPDATAQVLAKQHSSWVLVYPGDWIIREMDGNGVYPCRPDIFEATYEPAEQNDREVNHADRHTVGRLLGMS